MKVHRKAVDYYQEVSLY